MKYFFLVNQNHTAQPVLYDSQTTLMNLFVLVNQKERKGREAFTWNVPYLEFVLCI